MCRPRWAASFVAMLEMWPRLQPARTEWDASALVWLGFSRQRHLLKGKKSLTRPVDHPRPGEREGSAPWLKLRSEGDLLDELKNMLQGAGWAGVGPPCHPLSALTGIVGGPRHRSRRPSVLSVWTLHRSPLLLAARDRTPQRAPGPGRRGPGRFGSGEKLR